MEKKLRPDFLIVGMERSGTHWAAALLNAHPDVACFPTLPFYNEQGEKRVGEVHFFNTLASIYGENPLRFTRPFSDFETKYDKVFADLAPFRGRVPDEELVALFCKRYSDYCDKQRGAKKIVGEATAAYVFHLDLIDRLYPGIKKICIMRDPKDKVVSWHFNMLRKGKKHELYITREFALGYLEERIIPEYKALLAYTDPVHCLTYEALSEYTKEETESMVRFLDVSAVDDVITHMVDEASFEKQTARDGGGLSRQHGEENPRSGFRKGIVGDWKSHMSAELAMEIDERAGELQKKVTEKFSTLRDRG